METFAPSRPFVTHPGYWDDRRASLASLDLEAVDTPLRGIVTAFNRLTRCFTLQCCYGHFLHGSQADPHNLERLGPAGGGQVQYRIAYLALCLRNSPGGQRLHALLEQVPNLDPANIQFGSPEWFWERQVNSFALQVEPDRLKDRDAVTIAYEEALRIQAVRDRFFVRIAEVIRAS